MTLVLNHEFAQQKVVPKWDLGHGFCFLGEELAYLKEDQLMVCFSGGHLNAWMPRLPPM